MCSRLTEEVKLLRRCIDWLERMERGESVVVLGRIASDLEGLATGRPNAAEDGNNPAARHCRQLAEPQEQAKKLSTREERNALGAKLKLPPK
jgi:hypothetical protein